MSHKGIHTHRLASNPEEARFAKAWSDMQAIGRQLEWLLTENQSKGYPDPVSERDETVAATIVQWLGSPVGQGFLRDLGYEQGRREVSDLRLNGRDALTNAIMVACTAHAHQRDLGGEHAILHSLRVMQTVEPQTDEYRIAAVLHDVTEGNTGIDLGDLRDYRLSETIIAALDALRRRDGESYYDYIGRVCENQIACAVKRADLAHNMDMTRLGREPNAKDEARFQQYEAAWLRVLRCQRDKGWVAG